MIASLEEIINGDFSSIDNVSMHQAAEVENDAEHKAINPNPDLHPKTLAMAWESFQDNDLVKGLRIVSQNTMFGIPAPVFDHIDPEDAKIQTEYLRERLWGTAPIGADFHDDAKIIGLQALICGVGAARLEMRHVLHSEGQLLVPGACYQDIKSTWWDPRQSPDRSKWVAFEVYRRKSEIIKLWGTDGYAKCVEETNQPAIRQDEDPDPVVRLFEYFDCEGPNGTWAVFCARGLFDVLTEPLHYEANWFTVEKAGLTLPALPVEFLTYFMLPGAAQPSSIVNLGLRAQSDVWQAQRRLRDEMAFRLIRIVDEEQIHEDDRSLLRTNIKKPVTVRRGAANGNPDRPAIAYVKPDAGVSDVNMQLITAGKSEIQSTLGYSPYDAGQPGDVKFAMETSAIVNRANGQQTSIVAANAIWYGRLVQKFLGLGKKRDDAPVSFFVDGIPYNFGRNAEDGPIAAYLRTDGTVLVREDDLQYRTRQAETSIAAELYKLLGADPSFNRQKLGEDILKAAGRTDIESYLAVPQAPVQPMEGQPMAAQPMEQSPNGASIPPNEVPYPPNRIR